MIINLLIMILLLWLISKLLPNGDTIVEIVVGIMVLRFLGIL